MATRPARKPLVIAPASHFLVRKYMKKTAARPPVQAARVVLAATRPMPPKSIADRVEPGLKPYQPNHRMQPADDGDRQVVREHGAAAVALELAADARPEA